MHSVVSAGRNRRRLDGGEDYERRRFRHPRRSPHRRAWAFVGGVFLATIGFHAAGTIGTLITATLGAVVLLYLIRLCKRA